VRRAARITLLALGWASGCAGSSPRSPGAIPSSKDAGAASLDAGTDATIEAAGEPLLSLDELAARGATDAPLMREIARVQDTSNALVVRDPARDACFRAAFSASAPVRASLVDQTGAPRGEISLAATTGLVPPRGPACARKGESLRLVIESDQAGKLLSRAVVWQSP
jgi:hypothetical protein